MSIHELQGDVGTGPNTDVLAIDQALRDLATIDSEKSRLVELRYFGGLNNAELAEVMEISEATLARKWRIARAWLYQYLNSASSADSADDRVHRGSSPARDET